MHTPASVIHLYCIPYAGGSAAAAYGRWARLLPPAVRVVPLELAGHGRRTPEPFHDTLQDAAQDLAERIMPLARQAPFALYGHSMGTALVYELTRLLAVAGLPAPRTVFLSGRNPPHWPYAQRDTHLLPDERFLAEIRELGGTPDEFFSMQELVRAFLPVLRSDYRLIGRYAPGLPVHVTPADIVFLCSDRDPLVTRETVLAWAHYTSGRFEVADFPGGHFFIHEQAEAICRIVQERLLPLAVA